MPRINTKFFTDPLDQTILAIFRRDNEQRSLTAQYLWQVFDGEYSREIIRARLMALAAQGHLTMQDLPEGVAYKLAKPFRVRHITPLFRHNPEWVIEHREGGPLALCLTEFHAQLITNALNGD